jgi:hypothetical protein
MPAIFTLHPPEMAMKENCYNAVVKLSKIRFERHLDVIRATLRMCATPFGVKVSIRPSKSMSDKSTVAWKVYFDGIKVGTITETGIGKLDFPGSCPVCGSLITVEKSKGVQVAMTENGDVLKTNAHDVISASIWRSVMIGVFDKWFNESRFIHGRKKEALIKDSEIVVQLKNSLLLVVDSTNRSSFNGAATQGDRRTCKSCETLHADLSLIQRKSESEMLSKLLKDSHRSKELVGFKELVGLNYGGSDEKIGYSYAVIEEITKIRIDDVIRGIADELRNKNKYFETGANGKSVYKYDFLIAIGFDGPAYYDFLNDIRRLALEKSKIQITTKERIGLVQRMVNLSSTNNAASLGNGRLNLGSLENDWG